MEYFYRWYCMDQILLLLGLALFTSYSEGKANFIATPPSIVYTSLGGTVKLTWRYTVVDRIAEFQAHSPTWDIYFPNGTSIQLAYENKHSRIWNLSATCPSRLRDRLTIESANSLVINSVTINDSGTYGCTLQLASGQAISSRAKLVVIDPPQFISSLPQKVVRREGQDLSIICSARGSPTPTVTWVQLIGIQKVIKNQGIGNAALNIRNIRREQNGTYECQAKNNPNETPISRQTAIIVEYRPSINSLLSSKSSVPSWENHIVNLRCIVSGNPIPQVSWTGPHNNRIFYGVSALKNGSLLTLQTKDARDYGQYRCRASNSRGYDYRYIHVNRIVVPGPPVVLSSTSKVSTIELTWRRPTDDGGSAIIDYQISINTDPIRAVSVKDTSVLVAGLVKDTKYLISLYARNIVGYGNATSTLISTKNEADSPKPSISGSTVLGICLPLIFVLLSVIVVILVYNWWKRRKRKNLYGEEKGTKPADASKEAESIELEERHQKQNGSHDTPHKNYNGSCFQPFLKRPKRRPGQPRQVPRPLHILDSITEEHSDEPNSEESQHNKHDNKDNVEESEVVIEPKTPSDSTSSA